MITIIYDGKDASICRSRNGKDLQMVYEGIKTGPNIKYKLVVDIKGFENSVSLIDFAVQ